MRETIALAMHGDEPVTVRIRAEHWREARAAVGARAADQIEYLKAEACAGYLSRCKCGQGIVPSFADRAVTVRCNRNVAS